MSRIINLTASGKFRAIGRKFTNYIKIKTEGLNVIRGRDNVFVVPNIKPLKVKKRIESTGKN